MSVRTQPESEVWWRGQPLNWLSCETLKKVLLKIEYDGSAYHGWQIQSNHITIEEVIEKNLQTIIGSFVKVKGSSRTDSGVHAIGQTATITIPDDIPLRRLFISLNSLLPCDIAITDMVLVDLSFCERINAGKRYRYKINNSGRRKAIDSGFFWWVKDQLDQDKMREAARDLIGRKNFQAFQGKGGQANSFVKEITSITLDWEKTRDFDHLEVVVEGSGFLKHMVRNIVGTLVDIGRGRLPSDTFKKALKSNLRADLGMTAPAKGLILEKVFYHPDPFLVRTEENPEDTISYYNRHG